jgi:hypothetical protein
VGPPGQPTAAKRVATFGFFNAKEGTMNAEFWIELLILALRIVSAGLAS